MGMNSFLHKLTSRGPQKPSLSIVMLSNGIYISKMNTYSRSQSQATYYEVAGTDWEFALDEALKQEGAHNLNATVTLSSSYYQSYHIDKPSIPKEEWPSALPFLLKDLITDRVTDIVADGVEISQSSKVQAYVLTTQLLLQIKAVLERHNIYLLNVRPEDEVWSRVRPNTPVYMLLHRSKNSEFKIGVFVEQASVFQRTVRGIKGTMTGEDANSLEFDALALELQRSMDYLSSQLKQVQINTLFVCCDDENDAELIRELRQRLNVLVEALHIDDAHNTTGAVLASAAFKDNTDGINLYPKHLQPKIEIFTLNLVATTWVLIIIAMLSAYGFYSFKNYQIEEQIKVTKSEINDLNQIVEDLEKELESRQPSATKIAAVSRLKENIETNQQSLQVINSFNTKQRAGYAGIMQGLSSIGRSDISLNEIQINDGQLNVQGFARTPEVVPSWVKSFSTQLNLIGRNFESLSIGRNEQDIVTFSLRSSDGDDHE